MPLYEHLPVKVTVVIEIDGHTLNFEEVGEAKGARYHGADPRDNGYSSSDTLESSIRALVAANIARAAERANQFIAGVYPVADGAVLRR